MHERQRKVGGSTGSAGRRDGKCCFSVQLLFELLQETRWEIECTGWTLRARGSARAWRAGEGAVRGFLECFNVCGDCGAGCARAHDLDRKVFGDVAHRSGDCLRGCGRRLERWSRRPRHRYFNRLRLVFATVRQQEQQRDQDREDVDRMPHGFLLVKKQ